MGRTLIAGLALALGAAAAAQAQPIPAGAKYVHLRSSFASGPRITTSADTPPTRCARSADNYAHQVARRLGLALTDVSCSGATTAHLLGPWNELPPQLDAVDAATRLVTITVGGNDVRYSSGLAAEGCLTTAATAGTAPTSCGAAPTAPTEQEYADLEVHLRQVAQEAHRRAPNARVIFVDYPTVLPPSGVCPALSLTPAQTEFSRAINRRVVEATRRAAEASKSDLVPLSALSAGHNACSADPWTNGYPQPLTPDGVAFHPRLASHTAAAQAVEKLLSR